MSDSDTSVWEVNPKNNMTESDWEYTSKRSSTESCSILSEPEDSQDPLEPKTIQDVELVPHDTAPKITDLIIPAVTYQPLLDAIPLPKCSPDREGFIFSKVPPSPKGKVDYEVQMRFHRYWELKEKGVDMNEHIKNQKKFKNPSIYETLIERFGIDEEGTNLPKDFYDPHAFEESDFYDTLAEEQHKRHPHLHKPAKHAHHPEHKKQEEQAEEERPKKRVSFIIQPRPNV